MYKTNLTLSNFCILDKFRLNNAHRIYCPPKLGILQFSAIQPFLLILLDMITANVTILYCVLRSLKLSPAKVNSSHLQLASTWKIKQHFRPPCSKVCVNWSMIPVRKTTSSGAIFSTGNQCIRTPRCMIAGINLNKTGVVTCTKLSIINIK